MNKKIEIIPVVAYEDFMVQGDWPQILFWKLHSIFCDFPTEWHHRYANAKPVSKLVETIFYIGYSATFQQNVFACSLLYKFSAN